MNEQPPPQSQPSPARAKRAYAPPTVQRVELRPEEAVLGACKTGNSGGPRASRCRSIATCSTIGS